MSAKKPYRFERNIFYTDRIGSPFLGMGLICRDNHFYILDRSFTELKISDVLEFTGNTFHVRPPATKETVFPKGAEIVKRLGGEFRGSGTRITYVEPTGEQGRPPKIQNNRYVPLTDTGRRPANLVDIRKLSALVKSKGEEACLRPTDPAHNLKAVAAGSTVKLTWTPSKDPAVVGYIVRYGPKANSFANHVFAKDTSTEIEGLKPGKWHFTVAAHKDANVESWTLSNEAVAEVR
ncbi:hypothetical protein LCGC14_2232070 [marine sediment metagenome]|uniref:Fibronectin type-III domain-containing protein n=1 Tax=marine sediment metagenome TaxID=412755 RepID=A0A0F9DVP0_9ZZZZ